VRNIGLGFGQYRCDLRQYTFAVDTVTTMRVSKPSLSSAHLAMKLAVFMRKRWLRRSSQCTTSPSPAQVFDDSIARQGMQHDAYLTELFSDLSSTAP
jgi:hypothetical protein